MSYTVPVIPISREETDRQLENVVNRIQRHCKIGKVWRKPVKSALSNLEGYLCLIK